MADTDYIEYDSNKSGGSWWLKDEDWQALEDAGWEVAWGGRGGYGRPYDGTRWLGALATTARRFGVTMREAIEEWEHVTGQDHSDLGCGCCGAPHSFEHYSADGKIQSRFSPSMPEKGERYA